MKKWFFFLQKRCEKTENVNQYFLKNELSFAKHLTHVFTSFLSHKTRSRLIHTLNELRESFAWVKFKSNRYTRCRNKKTFSFTHSHDGMVAFKTLKSIFHREFSNQTLFLKFYFQLAYTSGSSFCLLRFLPLKPLRAFNLNLDKPE